MKKINRLVVIVLVIVSLSLQACDGGKRTMTESNGVNSVFSYLFCDVANLCDDTIGR